MNSTKGDTLPLLNRDPIIVPSRRPLIIPALLVYTEPNDPVCDLRQHAGVLESEARRLTPHGGSPCHTDTDPTLGLPPLPV